MVVTRSRLHAVKFYLAFRKVMEEKRLPFKALVAFSGEVTDPDTHEKYTENSLNRLPPKVAIEDAFKTPEYRFLVVASKRPPPKAVALAGCAWKARSYGHELIE